MKKGIAKFSAVSLPINIISKITGKKLKSILVSTLRKQKKILFIQTHKNSKRFRRFTPVIGK